MNVASYILLGQAVKATGKLCRWIPGDFCGMAYSAPRLLRLRWEKILLQIMQRLL